MKVVTLLGSAKKEGNTATVLGWIEKELESLGHDAKQIHPPRQLFNFNI